MQFTFVLDMLFSCCQNSHHIACNEFVIKVSNTFLSPLIRDVPVLSLYHLPVLYRDLCYTDLIHL